MKPNIDWVIHGCGNGVVCEIDGKTENGFMPGTCNFHTHGMERYNHQVFSNDNRLSAQRDLQDTEHSRTSCASG